MSSSAWQTAAVKEECETVLGVISRPGDNQDRSMCSLRLLKPPVQKAREKCTQSLQTPCFVSIALANLLIHIVQMTLLRETSAFALVFPK